MHHSKSIGSRIVYRGKQLARRHPVTSFLVAVVGLAALAWLLVLMLHPPFRYNGKTLGEWQLQLKAKEAEGIALEDWMESKTFYPHRVQRVFANLGDEGVLYLLGCAQFQESVFFSVLDKMPGNLRSLIPIAAPTLQKQSRTRALSILAGLDSDLLSHPQVLRNIERIALSSDNDAAAATRLWITHHPNKQNAMDALIETYVDNDPKHVLRFALGQLNHQKVQCEFPDDFVSRWFKQGDEVLQFFNATTLYLHDPQYFSVFQDAVRRFYTHENMKVSPIYPLASLLELHELEVSSEEKKLIFTLIWDVAEHSLIKAGAALGLAKMEGEDSSWWSKARAQVEYLPEVADARNFVQLSMVLQLFPDDEDFRAKLERELNQLSTYVPVELVDLLIKNDFRHEKLLMKLESLLESKNSSPISALKTIAYLEQQSESMRRSIERLCGSNDQEVQLLANRLHQKFSAQSK